MTVGNVEYSEAREFSNVGKTLPAIRAHDVLVCHKFSMDHTQ